MAKKVVLPPNDQVIKTLKNVVAFVRDPKVRLVIALATVALSFYLLLAFVSYLWTWDVDQSKLTFSLQEFADEEAIRVENWAGLNGAILADLWIHKWFGLPSFSLILVFFVSSFRIVNLRIMSLGNTLKYSVIGLIWGSVALAYIFGDTAFYLGGVHGYVVNNWLMAFLGRVGTGFVLFVTLFAFVLFTVDKSLLWLQLQYAKWFNKLDYDALQAKWLKEKPLKQDKSSAEPATAAKRDLVDSVEDMKREEGLMFDLKPDEMPFESVSGLRKPVESVSPTGDQVLKNEFILNDNGEQVPLVMPIANDLGFEVDNAVLADRDEAVVPVDTDAALADVDDDSPEGLRFRVEKNEDVLVDEFSYEGADYDPTLDLPDYKFPPLDLLVDHKLPNTEVTNEELLSNKNKIVETLRNFKIEIDKIKAVVGPTVTLYEIVPAPGVRISKIKSLEDDIALSLSALGIRIIAPMPGRGTIGIEVPNQKPKIVSMRSVIASAKFQETKYELPIAFGKNISNETYVVDLAKMPHLLVAGATGQGKSVGINVILTSLLYKKHPSQLKFVLIDPKKVELTLYDVIKKHYLAQLPNTEEPIITDNSIVINTLNSLNVEMDDRYQLLKAAQVRNIKEYNAKFIARRLNPNKGHVYLPYIVLVIDEFADLIMTAGKEVELPIARLAQLARAVGIHLIVATQRPSTNIITGVIKANFPARLAFKVASMIDSRTILDASGANQLIGRGDMLISEGSELVRLQCAFVDTPEVEAIAKYIGDQRGYPEPFILPEVPGEDGDNLKDIDLSKRDDLFEEAARMIVLHQQGSTSLIQRKLAIGYNRAGRIVDQLEAAGIVGAFEGSKARQVLYTDEVSLERFLSTLNEKN